MGEEPPGGELTPPPIAQAFVRIRPRIDETVRVLEALQTLAGDVESALGRCVATLTDPDLALDEGDDPE